MICYLVALDAANHTFYTVVLLPHMLFSAAAHVILGSDFPLLCCLAARCIC
jgi:hypothetical protein